MRIISSIALLLALSLPARAEDWPKWLGPRGDNISKETGLLEKWPDALKEVWKAEVGKGYAQPVAADGKIYLMTLVDKKDVLKAYDAATGRVLWEGSYDDGWSGSYPGTRAAPTIESGKIYTYGGNGQLVAWNLADGKQLWLTNILKETKADNLTWGVSSAPLIVGDLIFVQNGRGAGVPVVVGVDKNTGKITWQSEAKGKARAAGKEPQGGGYDTVVCVDVGGTKQLLVFGSDTIYGMNLADGKTIWSEPWETKYDVNASRPIYRDGIAIFTSDYDHGAIELKITPTGATKVWEKPDMADQHQPLILDGDLVFGNSQGVIKCLAWPSGDVLWTAKETKLKLGMGGPMLRVGDKLIALSERGRLSLIKATKEGFELVSQQDKVVEGTDVWTMPVIYNGKLYIKGQTTFVCLDISGK